MTAYAVVQAIVIAAMVAWAVVFAARRLLPTPTRRLQAHVANWLGAQSHAAWVRRIGASMQPTQAPSGGCGSGSCSTCGTCASSATPSVAATEARPLVFRPKA